MFNTRLTCLSLGMAFLVISVGVVSAQEKLDRTHLPIQEPKRATYSELDVRNVKDKPPFFAVTAPKNAPNVVIVLIDDIGFGGPSTFGGPIQTPTLDKLAKGGLKFNNFHTTASARRRGWHSKRGGITTPPTPVRSWRVQRVFPATLGRFPTVWLPWPRCSD